MTWACLFVEQSSPNIGTAEPLLTATGAGFTFLHHPSVHRALCWDYQCTSADGSVLRKHSSRITDITQQKSVLRRFVYVLDRVCVEIQSPLLPLQLQWRLLSEVVLSFHNEFSQNAQSNVLVLILLHWLSSVRRQSENEMSMEEFTALLWFRCGVTKHRAGSWETYLTPKMLKEFQNETSFCDAGVAETLSGVCPGLISASAVPGCSQMAPFSLCSSAEAFLEINTPGIKEGSSPRVKSAEW